MEKHFTPQPEEGLPNLPEGVEVSVGTHQGAGRKIGIVAARFNIRLTGALVSSAVETLMAHGVSASDIQVVWVPGSFEIPLALKRLHHSFSPQALIPMGVVLEGATLHAELIMRSLTKTFTELSLELDCPVIDAVVSSHTIEQAEERCLSGSESRGAYAALAALECAAEPRERGIKDRGQIGSES
ncbi:6,7-dimethyl-8-ribityllumazine synthase [Kiritimatiellaeota bacterium B1221]|nr:6,7-dimethyl-8-ribityllumazine synthase [Kiritimatiellaeota bacterium B1221]